jgi:signal transduction histidine kinase/CheY-like chemotaxis protein
MSSPLRVLLVDIDEEHAAPTRLLIAAAPAPAELELAAGYDAGLERMLSDRYDAHLVACDLGARRGVELLRAYRNAAGEGAVILIADEADRAEDFEAMECGASDYLVAALLDADAFERSLRYAVDASRIAADLRRVRDELQSRVGERTAALETLNAALADEVAERRAAERALRDAARGKDEFLATLAHELRNPLAPLSSALEILSRSGGVADGGAIRERALDVMRRQVAHMVRLIDDLLDLSRFSHGKLELRREWISLDAVIESALETARPLLVVRRQAFELVVPDEPLLLHVDPTRVAQVLSNLLSNAAKYTEPGGRIRLEAARDRDDVVLSVSDSGIGIPAEHLAHVFTMFGQGTRAYDAVYGGLGIGLALAKSLAELHGGSLTAASGGRGAGSVFTLRLACASEGPAVAAAEQPAPVQPPAPRRILVVDDNVEAALTLAELLSLDGHETHVAHDGPSGVDMAHRLSPDVAIVDLGLPGFDGLEVARRMRAVPASSGLLLVALSGWVQPDDRARTREAGFDHHLAKPLQLKSLELVLQGDRRRIP